MNLNKNASGEKELQCPRCMTNTHVYHCSWTAMTCQYCKADVEKTDWIVAAQPTLAADVCANCGANDWVKILNPGTRKYCKNCGASR